MWYCYILRCVDEKHKNLTYNGSTNNITRRLKQHNGILKGGAKATHGKKWEIYILMTGFGSHKEALSCEWKIKHPTNTKKRPQKYCGVNGRVCGLNEIIVLDKWTSKCETNVSDGNYDLYVFEDVVKNIAVDLLPENIKLHIVSEHTEFFNIIETTDLVNEPNK